MYNIALSCFYLHLLIVVKRWWSHTFHITEMSANNTDCHLFFYCYLYTVLQIMHICKVHMYMYTAQNLSLLRKTYVWTNIELYFVARFLSNDCHNICIYIFIPNTCTPFELTTGSGRYKCILSTLGRLQDCSGDLYFVSVFLPSYDGGGCFNTCVWMVCMQAADKYFFPLAIQVTM